MPNNTGSSAEQLDDLLGSGKISRQEYDTLNAALAAQPDEKKKTYSECGRRLTKSWKNRQIGGVCGGIADYFAWRSDTLRIGTLILGLMSFPVVAAIYLILYFILPWDEKPVWEARKGSWFYAAVVLSLVILLVLFAVKIAPSFIGTFEGMGAELPRMTQVGIGMTSFLGSTAGLTVQFLATAFLVMIFFLDTLSNTMRKIIFWLAAFFLMGLLVSLVLAFGLPLKQVATHIGT